MSTTSDVFEIGGSNTAIIGRRRPVRERWAGVSPL
jgi:hypothetical protein